MSSSIVAKKDIGERKSFQRVEPRATEDDRLGAYSLGTEEGFNQGLFFILRVGVVLETMTQCDFRIASCLSLFPFLPERKYLL